MYICQLYFTSGAKKRQFKHLYTQYPVRCCGRRRPLDGLHQQPCSHQPTARVGHSRGFFRHFDFMTMDEAKKTRWTSTFKQDETSLTTIITKR
jgi:hypothetical protein